MQPAHARVLIVDDDEPSRRLLEVRLRALRCGCASAEDGQQALAAIEAEPPHVVLLDLEMPCMSGLDLLHTLKQRGLDFPVIVITAHGSIDKAVEAMKAGAHDFITKPFEPARLETVVRKALERQHLQQEIEVLIAESGDRYRLVTGSSPRMKDVVKIAEKAAASKATVLLLGESGTGKEVLARAIHNWSERKHSPFVAVNCVGLANTLVESELFGHEKGAFTGAVNSKKGKLEIAHEGTLFLDEIGDISQELQTKLLRFLQEREFERVGGTKPIQVDVRIIAATNRNLRDAVNAGHFRADLFYRLNVIPIQLPPLRDRPEDIPQLVEFFAEKFAREAKKPILNVSPEAMDLLHQYSWPGNVRELANVIERAVVLDTGVVVTRENLEARISADTPRKLSYRENMEATRRELVLQALEQCDGNRAAAARALGLHEKYLLRLIKSLNIK